MLRAARVLAGLRWRLPLRQATSVASSYTDAMHTAWRKDPASVDPSWRVYFEKEGGVSNVSSGTSKLSTLDPKEIIDNLKVETLVRAFVVRGHNVCDLDPLGILNADLDANIPQEVTLEHYGFTEVDMDRSFVVPPSPLFDRKPTSLPLREIVNRLQSVYCNHIGAEFSHIQDIEQVNWWKANMEQPFGGFNKEQSVDMLRGLIEATGFERFLQKKFKSEKRFGLDGCEVLVPGMQQMIRRLAEGGVEMVVVGMPHRGRLNVLANVMQKPMAAILKEFQSLLEPGEEGSGDVKYHLGVSSDVRFEDLKRTVHLSLLANPSHLEAVNPVVEGKVRAEQDYRNDSARQTVVPILLHGDASFAGQGVVSETLSLSALEGYGTGGTIHLVVNNQIGFTTDPRFSRSTPYCTDVAKMVNAPILHVNADDTEAVVRCFNMAADYRMKFNRDVVIDLVCYRRFGHNEADQPVFTQPLMYHRIATKTPVLDIFSQELIKKGVVTAEEIQQREAEYDAKCTKAFESAPKYKAKLAEFLGSRWASIRTKVTNAKIFDTGVDLATLKMIGVKTAEYPSDMVVHPTLKGILQRRIGNMEQGTELDYAACEALAFGSLLLEGNHVRLSGQDVERGTFSHRHTVLHDQSGNGRTHVALQHLSEKQGKFSVFNSNLSEFAVLGFELGYSQANPMSLVLWEAQFGDFSNTAQTIIDQFLTSGESKWHRASGLVMLLPHGYEGMGPEHSSARMERYLQMCADDESVYPVMDHFARTQIERCNYQIVNCTTPANYFHILRRQIHREFRKPLVVFTPKSLLRLPEARSSFKDISPGTRFLRMIPETDKSIFLDGQSNDHIRRVIFCQGKVYYDLIAARTQANIKDIAIARVEQISPFPFDLVHRHADNFPNAEVVWVQEEPRNMGAWQYVAPRIETAMLKTEHHKTHRPRYVGRHSSAATATGDKLQHKKEQAAFIGEALA